TEKLEIHSRQTGNEKYIVRLLNYDMPLPVDILTDKGLQRMTIDKRGIEVASKTPIQIDPKGYYLKKMILE
ncbi:MAG TPA: hypothetical protein VI548_09725, partial [Chitinophagaceae bacterium]|nr:hypothetical protein [Chitinophagaceae bacterium]